MGPLPKDTSRSVISSFVCVSRNKFVPDPKTPIFIPLTQKIQCNYSYPSFLVPNRLKPIALVSWVDIWAWVPGPGSTWALGSLGPGPTWALGPFEFLLRIVDTIQFFGHLGLWLPRVSQYPSSARLGEGQKGVRRSGVGSTFPFYSEIHVFFEKKTPEAAPPPDGLLLSYSIYRIVFIKIEILHELGLELRSRAENRCIRLGIVLSFYSQHLPKSKYI